MQGFDEDQDGRINYEEFRACMVNMLEKHNTGEPAVTEQYATEYAISELPDPSEHNGSDQDSVVMF